MSDIADKLKRATLFLKQLECKCRPVRDDVDIVCHRCCALAEFPDPDAVGECVDSLREAETTLRGYYNKRAATSALVVADRIAAGLAKLEEADYSNDKERDRYLAEGGDPH